ncbi:protease inhibitor I42 family protein [Raoultibacter phocaeensis]|uniref:protease inhibitor I42 family protein n=1 Tax=Raoultibacter phocaeensis TaxID=2479841 RepID=UPI001118C7E7|nr:protease inhibitor I42 family protein [Raoultibacter phocaeensis]
MDTSQTKPISKIALVIAGIAALAVVAVLSSCSSTPQQTIKISLQSNAGTGYEWVVDGETPSTLQQMEANTEPESSDEMAGGPVTTTYMFQAIQEGDGTISFRLERSWEPAEDDLQVTYHFTVDKDLNVTFDGSEGTYIEGEEIPQPEIYAQ